MDELDRLFLKLKRVPVESVVLRIPGVPKDKDRDLESLRMQGWEISDYVREESEYWSRQAKLGNPRTPWSILQMLYVRGLTDDK